VQLNLRNAHSKSSIIAQKALFVGMALVGTPMLTALHKFLVPLLGLNVGMRNVPLLKKNAQKFSSNALLFFALLGSA